MKIIIEKIFGAIFSVMVFCLAMSLVLTSCKTDENNLPQDEPNVLPSVQRKMENVQLVAIAVGRVFDGKALSVKRSNSEDVPPILKYEYPFDYVKINSAMRYTVNNIDFPLLNEVCGEGEIEVFLTSFDTYIFADETKNIKSLKPFIFDNLIVFRGELGIYSCMENSATINNDDMNNFISSIFEYSSHKRFGDKAIEKDFTPPLYQFYVKTQNDERALACIKSNEIGEIPPENSLEWTTLQGDEIVSSEELFSPIELHDMPQMSLQCTITEIGENYFLVKSNENLEKICFDELTLFVIDDLPAKVDDFEEGDSITVSFDKLYERYNPKIAIANMLVMN